MKAELLKIQLLGGFSVRVNGAVIPEAEWRSKRARSLVKLLALAPNVRLQREQVLDALWPDSDFSAAANNLHQTLFSARKIFETAGVSALRLEDGLLSLGEGVGVDAVEFEAAAERAHASQDPALLRGAIDLYSGDLLPEDLYEEWTLARRESLGLLHLNLLLELARLCETTQNYTEGIEALRRALTFDRALEEAHLGLMRLYALAGQRQPALRQYQLMKEALQGELGVEPGPAAQRMYEDIQTGRVSSQPGSHAAPITAYSKNQLPSGTVTFLFSDIEGSTRHWQQQPKAMTAAAARHQFLLRGAVEANGGQIFKVIGDQFQAAFRLAQEGVQAAAAAQQALQVETWPAEIGELRVRMGLHTGPAELEGQDYAVSHTLNRAARVMSAGFGGQVLLAREAAELAGRHLAEGMELLDLGEQQLKGLQLPEHLYQLCAPGLRRDFPRLATTISRTHNLPAQLTSFVGRETEIGEMGQKIKAQRLVTLTGSGGTGKTRLALQVAEQALEDFPDGIFYVELAPISDPALIPQVCIQVLDLAIQPGIPPITTLIGYLGKKHPLILLDNCEHMTQACTSLVSELLKDCPRLHILATSREILSVPGELPFRVPSLAFPQARSLPSLEELAEYEAIRLFLDRAGQVQPGFELNQENAPFLAQICQRLDGIPLAIELAAARVRLMPPAQIAARLDQAFRLLSGGSKAMLPRQQTLKASIDWSYNLLSAKERLLLQRLSVFVGGWTLEAAEAVCADGERSADCATEKLEPEEILDLMANLVDKSLASVSIQREDARYRLLETIRQYARERLIETGCGAEVRGLHLVYHARLSGEADPHLRGRGQIEWLQRLDEELDNLRAALEWSLSSQIEQGLKIAADLMWYWQSRGLFEEGLDWLDRLLEGEAQERGEKILEGERALQRARGLRCLCFLSDYSTRDNIAERFSAIEESLAILRAIKPLRRLELGISIFYYLGQVRQIDLPSPAREEMLDIFYKENAKFYLSEYFFNSAFNEPDLEHSLEIEQTSLALCREIEDWDGIASRCTYLAWLKTYNGAYAEARTLVQEAIETIRNVKNHWFEAGLLDHFAMVALAEGNYEEAIQKSQEALARFRGMNYLTQIDVALGILQQAAWARGDFESSTRYAQEALEPCRERHFNLVTLKLYLGRLALSQEDIPQAQIYLREAIFHPILNHIRTGWRMPIPHWLGWIHLYRMQGRWQEAAFLIGNVDGIYRQTSPGLIPRERSEYEEDWAAVRAGLGEEGFGAACAGGVGLNFGQVREWILETQR